MADRQYGLRATEMRWAVIETGTLTKSGFDEVLHLTEKKVDCLQWQRDHGFKDPNRYSIDRVQVLEIKHV